MRQAQHEISIRTRGKGLHDVTLDISDWIREQAIAAGLLTIFIKHTSASLLVQENADPDVLADLDAFLDRLVPTELGSYRHSAEGADDMPAHIRAALTQTQLSIPIVEARMGLGVWQAIYLYEHRVRPHARSLLLHLIGE